VPQAFAQTSGNYENISVNEAYKMIKKARGNLVILDVRNHSEYNLGHLYDAVLIPVYELEERISELQEHVNDPIIVYCKAGSRSQIACEILAAHGFTKVYNMLGGITAWMEAGYPIYTTYHHVTVNVLDEEILLQVEPLLLYQAGCTSCGCQSCGQNQNYNITPNITVTTLEQNETYTLTLVTYEVNDTAYEVAIAQTLLWNYNEASDEANRTAKFISTEITAEDTYMQFYSLSYIVQHAEYNLTLYTTLTPLESETYNSSFTIMNYAPAEKSVTSMEFVEFNSSVTLSQQYAILGKVAKEIGKVYEKSGDETLAQLAQGYYIMEKEAKGLSKLVEKQLTEYDKIIQKSSAVIMDQDCMELCGGIVGVIAFAACCVYICPCYVMWWCIPICGAIAAAITYPICSGICGNVPTICEFGCAVACGAICSPFDPATGFVCGIACESGCNSMIGYLCG